MLLIPPDPDSPVRKYRIHLLVFILALLASLTVAHPQIFVTDEWITINQLAQLQEGHQVLLNEGKYIPDANSTYAAYFTNKGNLLAYPLFLPVISLPALLVVNGLDRFFSFFCIYAWTLILVVTALFLNTYFPEFVRIGKYRWTSGVIAAAFVLFFASLFLARPLPVTGPEAFPEVMAVVLTNMILFCLMAVMIYEINRTVFTDTAYSLFGTLVCLSCSSYLFWANYCKDHLLVAFLFTLLILLVVKYLNGSNRYLLCGAFVMTGLIAWARPELALFVFVSLCVLVLFIFVTGRNRFRQSEEILPLVTAPLFTFIGAIPFCINNYLFTGNPLIPAWIFWEEAPAATGGAASVTAAAVPVSRDTIGSLLHLFIATTHFQPDTFLPDLYGVLFNPQSGSLGIFPVVPLFLTALFLIPVLWIFRQWDWSEKEKHLIVAMALLAAGVFVAYLRGITGLNTSVGIVPDMRYLSPLYLPLSIIGLCVLQKLPGVTRQPAALLKNMATTWIVLIPVTIFVLVRFYPVPETADDLFRILDSVSVLGIYLLVAVTLLAIIATFTFRLPDRILPAAVAVTCALPLVWQIDVTFVVRMYGIGLGGYSFLVPAMRTVLLLHFV